MKTLRNIVTVALVAGLASFASGVQDAKQKTKPAKAPVKVEKVDSAAVIAQQKPSYPLDTCPVGGDKLGDKAVDHVVDGRLVRLCCKACVKQVDKGAERVIAQIDKAVIAAQAPSYPIKTCLISDEPIDSMGGPLDIVHGTRLVRLCCKGCTKAFKKDPGKYMEVVDKALIREQRKDYPLENCAVSGEPLEKPIDQLYGTTLVRLCCKGCVKGFRKDPGRVVAMIHDARAKAK